MLQPHPKSPGLEAGVSENMIRGLVHAFYANVRKDDALGPVFDAHVQNWDEHLDKMCAFWSSVTLLTGSYKGRPMDVHAQLPEISDELFDAMAAAVPPRGAGTLPARGGAPVHRSGGAHRGITETGHCDPAPGDVGVTAN